MALRYTIYFSLFLTLYTSAQIDLKIYGQKILDNKIKPTDDKYTFQIIDSLLCKSKLDRDFYFNVFNKIQQNSDGALSEYVSTIASKFYFNHNIAFIKKSSKMGTKSIHQWLDFVAFDLYVRSENDEKDLPSIKTKIYILEHKFPVNSKDKIKCKTFNDYLYEKIVALMKAG